MNYKSFEKIINTLLEDLKRSRDLYKLGIELHNDDLLQSIEILLQEIFGKEKYEWISWFIYDNEGGKKGLEATDNGEPICTDIKSLYEYVSGKQL